MHHRLAPKQHRFHYDVFLFYLDLAEVDSLSRSLRWMSRNRFNLFNFRDRDHIDLRAYLREQGVEPGRVMLLTNLCTLGYQFNPVSFYFCYDPAGKPLCSVVEVCNTFREMKPYYVDTYQDGRFTRKATKYFYVSPFADHDTDFDFELGVPGESLKVRIDDYDREGNRFFISTLTGEARPLTDARLLGYFFRFPLITLQVITLIHWHALRLWWKRLPFHRKTAFPDLQRDIYQPKSS
jgi:DUF1365 family protein